MGAEQVGYLLDACIGSWDDPERARSLLEHARGVHSDSERPVSELRSVVRRLERGQRLLPAPPPASCDVGRVARAAVHVARSALDPSVRIQLALSDSAAAAIDASDLGQTLLHLISHAAQGVDQVGNGLVEVGVRTTPEGVQVLVASRGLELAEDQLARVFDPRLASGSPGVGLALSKQLVERAGGVVHAEIDPSGGARFVVTLPMADDFALA